MRKSFIFLAGVAFLGLVLLLLLLRPPPPSREGAPPTGLTTVPANATPVAAEPTPSLPASPAPAPAAASAPASAGATPQTTSAATPGAPPAPLPLSESAARQIRALQDAKAARTPTQSKIDSELLAADKMRQGQPVARGITNLQVDLDQDAAGRVLVDIKADVSPELLRRIESLGGTVLSSFAQHQAIRARLPLAQMEPLASRSDVKFVEPAAKATTHTGPLNSEGDATHSAGLARSTFHVGGAGVKVGVISDSVDHLADSQAAGELGTVTVLAGQSGVPGSGEGTAMLEIVHDLAPDAPLYFATAFQSVAGFAENIRQLRTAGCDIIVDDVGYFNEPPFQDGPIAEAVNEVTAGGALYFSSAGNSGNKSDGQSGTWEGDFVDGGTHTLVQGRLHSFGTATYDTVTSGGSSYRADLFWADPLARSTNDYDLFVLDAAGANVVTKSDNGQTGTQDPYESVGKVEVGQRILIVRYAGSARFLHLDTGRGRLAISTGGKTRGHASAANAFCVAAVEALTSYPDAFIGGTKNPVERFSSDGTRRVFFHADGTPITPGNFSATGGAIRQKPDIAAADGVKTSVPGFNPFHGTSAAAPHAAAIAALLKSLNPALTPAQMRDALVNSALDIEAPGTDSDAGYGLIMALGALQAAPGSSPPLITGFTPGTGSAGTTVTITGTKFTGVTAVRFNNVSAAFTVDSATQITATVPAAATTGRISVTAPAGTATSANNFTVTTAPSITSFTPSSGPVGGTVVIIGANFTGATVVSFNGVNATFAINSATQITAAVPTGAATGRLSVTTPSGTANSAANFSVTTLPVLAGFTPSSGGVGTSVAITGANLAGATSVTFNNVSAAFTANSGTQITATVPAAATTGPIRVTTPAGNATSASNFVVIAGPVLTSFAPPSGAAGASVTIQGQRFTGATSVRFNGVAASVFTVDSDTQVTALVPVGATTGPLSVVTPGGTVASAGAFTVLAAPANDLFANAQLISGNSGSATGTNTAATKEVNEPNHAGNPGGKSIWYRWIAPSGGTWKFDTLGSGFDTLLAVYTGNAVTNLTVIAANDDVAGTTNSSVTFAAVSGTIYRVVVDGYMSPGGAGAEAASGRVVLNWALTANAPAITSFAPGTGAVGTPVVITGANFTGATAVHFNGVAASFTINSATQITASVPPGATTGPISVTTSGGAATSLNSFAVSGGPANDNFAAAQALTTASGTATGANTGTTKEAGEPNHAGNAGGRSVWFMWTVPASGTVSLDTLGSGFDTLLAVYTGTSVNGLALVAANDDSSSGVSSLVSFNAVAGTIYRIAVDGYGGASGPVTLHWASTPNRPVVTSFTPSGGPVGSGVMIRGTNFTGATAVQFGGASAAFTLDSATQLSATVPPGAVTGPIGVVTPNGRGDSASNFVIVAGAPFNDSFANALTLTGAAAIVSGHNLGASKEAGEPNHAGNAGGKSVWYRWTAPSNGWCAVETTGSAFDTLLAVYTGAAVSSLTPVASDDDSGGNRTSRFLFNAVAGTTYRLAVDGYGGDGGNLVLKLLPARAPNTIFSTGFEAAEGYARGTLTGQKGWVDFGSGGNGVATNLLSGSVQQAYIGYAPPNFGDQLFVWQPLNYTPNTNSLPVVEFSVLMEIDDSSNFAYDDFHWSVFNLANHQLFSLTFNNSTLDIAYLLDDGADYVRTGFTFENGVMYHLIVTMDFGRNRWSATLGDAVLVRELPITTTGAARDLGDIDAVWVPRNDFAPGDNFMIFDDYQVVARPSLTPRIVLAPQSRTVAAGSDLFLGVVADGGAPLAHQWRLNGVDLPGATGPVLLVENVTPSQGGNYTVAVTNDAGSVLSAVAIVTVTGGSVAAPAFSAPSLSMTAGFSASLNVANGLSYRLQGSTNFTTWNDVTNGVGAGAVITVRDPAATNFSRRFYRVIAP
ncbi:MAG: IPT/TIG domain-containing protein [Verrucomicrobia bacterium]|nr:IPT/TIG domain-containing protein [Verrucomicrobiota bacterium]